MHKLALKKALTAISTQWDDEIIPQLEHFIRIPNKSPAFDPDWKANGHMNNAMTLIVNWCQSQPINHMRLELIEDQDHTPLLFIEIDGNIDETILLYGHMDKQPEMKGWDEDKGPWIPVIQDGKLYGRGGADDGYAVFASLTAIKTLQENHIPHARCVILIEASEESGSEDLPHYLQLLKEKIGNPNFIICLDSGCGNYEQLWSTTSLRGLVDGVLTIEVLKNGIHSGVGSGVVPSTTAILRQLLDRIENSSTHEIILDAFKVAIPQERVDQAYQAAEQLGHSIVAAYPFSEQTQPSVSQLGELLLNRTWRAALSVTAQEGLPSIEKGGNVTLPRLSVKLSIRIPPQCDPNQAALALKQVLEANPPHQATISFTPGTHCATGWNAPPLAPWLEQANNDASLLFYDKPAAYIGEGGTIPFMAMLGDLFPNAQFLIAGVLGPKSNAHGPNEFLHIDMAKRLTGCIASVIASHYEAFHK